MVELEFNSEPWFLETLPQCLAKCGPEVVCIGLIQGNCRIRFLGPAQSIEMVFLVGGDWTHQVFLMHLKVSISTPVHTVCYNLVVGGWQIFFLYGDFSVWRTPPRLP